MTPRPIFAPIRAFIRSSSATAATAICRYLRAACWQDRGSAHPSRRQTAPYRNVLSRALRIARSHRRRRSCQSPRCARRSYRPDQVDLFGGDRRYRHGRQAGGEHERRTLLRVASVSKRFGEVTALSDVPSTSKPAKSTRSWARTAPAIDADQYSLRRVSPHSGHQPLPENVFAGATKITRDSGAQFKHV